MLAFPQAHPPVLGRAPRVFRVFRLVCGDAPAAVLPLLAVIIPVYATTQQDVALLQRALRHLARQEGRPPTHVVLVDDASPRSLNVSYAGGGQVLPLCPLPLGSLQIDWAPESTAALAAGGLAQSQPKLQGPILATPVWQHVMQCARVGAGGIFTSYEKNGSNPQWLLTVMQSMMRSCG